MKSSLAARLVATSAAIMVTTALQSVLADTTSSNVTLSLRQTHLSVEPWGAKDGQQRTLQGRLVYEGRPIAQATLAYLGETTSTDKSGIFHVTIPTDTLDRIQITVQSLQGAKWSGGPVPETVAHQVQNQAIWVDIGLNLSIQSQSESKDGATTTVRLKLKTSSGVPVTFQIDKYVLQGTVERADHTPISGAIVSVTADGGEYWAKSQPTDDQGFYRFKVIPSSDDDDTYRVQVGQVQYALPKNKVFNFPDNTSSQVDVTLPQVGTTIVDRPPTLVASTIRGAMYQGMVVGLADTGVAYTTTAPTSSGLVTVTMPTSAWKSHPRFFEASLDAFFATPVKPGQRIPSSLVRVSAEDPLVTPH